MGKIVKDVAYLKSVLNPEKKRITMASLSSIGQLNGNNSGHYLLDFTPIPSEGIQYNSRTGSSIKLHSTNVNVQIGDLVSQTAKMRFIIEIWEVKGIGLSALGFSLNNICNNIYSSNTFVTGGTSATMIDYYSQPNPDFYNTARLIRRVKTSVQADNMTGVNNITSFRFGIKYNRGKGHHVRFDKDSVGISQGQLFMVVRADRGNMSGSTVSTCSGVVDTAVNTGATFRWNAVHYYYDN